MYMYVYGLLIIIKLLTSLYSTSVQCHVMCSMLCEGDKVSPEECKRVSQGHSDAVRHWRKRKRMASTCTCIYIIVAALHRR